MINRKQNLLPYLLTGILYLLTVITSGASSRQKVGVVLSGGGAKGAAHIGVLKALEEEGIPVDYIVGTSMGAIIGGLYSIGYSPSQLDTLIRTQDWEILLSDLSSLKRQTLQEREESNRYLITFSLEQGKQPIPDGLVRGRNLATLLSRLTIGYHDSISFDSLPIPFACVATNLTDGKEIVIRHGKLHSAIRSSMSIPGIFSPVRIDSMVLVDGGLTNNYPVDVAREIGADIVIGSTVQSSLLPASQINSMGNILSQILSISCANKLKENIANCDINIHTPTSDYKMMDFKPSAIDTIINRGYYATLMHRKQLDSIKQLLPVPSREYKQRFPVKKAEDILLRKVDFQIENHHEIKTLSRKCLLKSGQSTTISRIEEAVHLLQEEYNYPNAFYTLSANDSTYDLTLYSSQKSTNSIKAGMRFDSQELLAALVKGELYFHTALPSSLSIIGKIGKQSVGGITYSFEPFLHRKLEVSYEFSRHDMNLDKKGNRDLNLVFRKHTGTIQLADFSLSNFSCKAGLSLESFRFSHILSGNTANRFYNMQSDTYINYFFQLDYNSLNRIAFPSRGWKMHAGYTLHTDDMLTIQQHSPLSAIDGNWMAAIPLNDKLTLCPGAGGRVLLGKQIPPIYSNVTGSDYDGKYLPQQISFIGMTNIEPMGNTLVTGHIHLQQQIHNLHYISLYTQFALSSDKIRQLSQSRFLYCTALQYGYDSKVGPLKVHVAYTGHGNRLTGFVSMGFNF